MANNLNTLNKFIIILSLHFSFFDSLFVNGQTLSVLLNDMLSFFVVFLCINLCKLDDFPVNLVGKVLSAGNLDDHDAHNQQKAGIDFHF